jgi:transposase
MEFMGLDVHKQYSVACVFDDSSGEMEHHRLNNSRAEFQKLFSVHPEAKVVMEAGRSSYMVYDTIEDLVSDIRMANPLQVKAIAWAVVKTDKVDAETLSRLLRADVVPQSYLRDKENRETLYLLRQRMFFVKVRTMVKNRIHCIIDRQSEEIRFSKPQVSDLFGTKGKQWLRDLKLPLNESRMLQEELGLLDFLDEKILSSNRLLYKLIKEDPIAQRLATIPGIGIFYALLIRAEIGDIDRFPDDSKLIAYAGLAPSVSASGGKSYSGRLPRQCNHWLKWALIEAVYPAIKKNFWLKNKYNKIAKRKNHNTAKVATARLLMTLVYKIWKSGRVFSQEKPLQGKSNPRMALSHS